MVAMTPNASRTPWTAELYARAVAGAVLPDVLWGSGDVLPASSKRRTGVRFEADKIAAYRGVCGGSGTAVPPAMPHLPGFPLALQLMTARDFPMSALGMVHLFNRIERLAPVEPGQSYDVEVSLADPREHSRGVVFDAVTSLLADGQPVWREASTYLSRGSRLADAGPSDPRQQWPEPGPDCEQVEIAIPENTGRRYAAVSGDRNPIHLHPLAAKAFGFRTTIVHGMWTLARCLAEVEAELPDSCTIEAGFFKPVFLPAECALRVQRSDSRWDMWLDSGDVRHAVVTVTAS